MTFPAPAPSPTATCGKLHRRNASAGWRSAALCAALLLGVSGCGTGAVAPRSEVTDADRASNQPLSRWLRGRYPSLLVSESGSGVEVSIRRTGMAPLVIIDGFRRAAYGVIPNIPVAEIAKVEVLTSMGETLVFGADAAERGVVRITTRLADGDPDTR